jgi:hypothetical protein
LICAALYGNVDLDRSVISRRLRDEDMWRILNLLIAIQASLAIERHLLRSRQIETAIKKFPRVF